jgi:hypothetical protein
MCAAEIQTGQMPLQAPLGEYDQLAFIIQQALAKMQTSTIVRVDSCTNAGGLSPVGFVDVTPLVNQVDSQGNPMPLVTIHGLPYSRIQGGANAIIIDPAPGDLGIALFASRDISNVKRAKAQANPGSHRQYNFSDGMYIGGLLNGTPTQFIQFNGSGITISSPAKVDSVAATSASITAPSISLGSAGQTLHALVTSIFMSLFNSHTHLTPSGESHVPTQQMDASHMTTVVKGG